jgi:hypothetical protein
MGKQVSIMFFGSDIEFVARLSRDFLIRRSGSRAREVPTLASTSASIFASLRKLE